MDEQDAGYMEAFGQQPTAEQPPASPEDNANTNPEPAQEQQPAPVEYVQITKDDYQRITQALDRLPTLETNFSKRIDTALGKIGGLERDLKSGAGGLTAEDLAPFENEFPELHAALSKVRAPADFGAVLEERTKPLVDRLETAVTELRETQEAAVELAHPDFREFSASQDFQAWLATKDDEYRSKLATTWAPRMIVSALNEAKKFAAERGGKPSSRNEVMEAAIQPRGTGGGKPSNRTAYDAYLDAWRE